MLKLKLWETFRLRSFAAMRIPMLFWCLPTVTRLDETGCAVLIRLNRRTRNHLGSMYFGALCVGVDCAGGLIAYRQIQKSGKPVSLIFKDFKAEFLKRAEGDVEFLCDQGEEIREFVERVVASSERMELTVRVQARLAKSSSPEDLLGKFELTLSLKNRSKSAISS